MGAFALACNVMQVITFSLKAVQVCREISLTGSTSTNQHIKESSEQIADAAEGVHELLHPLQSTSTPLTKAQTELQNTANQCIQTAHALQKKLKPIQKGESGRRRAILRATLKSLFGEKDIQEIESRLREYENRLQTRILVNMK